MKRIAFLLAATILTCVSALAQAAYPSKPIIMIVPFPPGGALDIVARSLAEELRKQLGQAVVVDNRAGAGGTIGSAVVAKAAPDGHTILFGSVATHAIAAGLYSKLAYDPIRDFVPITQLTSAPLLVTSSATLPATTLTQLFALARAQPGKLNYASTGNGTAVHLAGELLKSAAKLDVVHIPYKGGAEAVTALISGDIAYMVVNVQLVLPQVRAGKARALAVTGGKRLATLPDVPTLEEAGLPGVEVTTWFGLFAPAGTPAEIVSRLQREASVALVAMRERLAAQGDDAVGSTPEQFAAFVRAENAKWVKVVQGAGVRID